MPSNGPGFVSNPNIGSDGPSEPTAAYETV